MSRPLYGAAIARRRELLGLSKRALAFRVLIDPSFITRLETGDRDVSLQMLERVANALEVRASVLVREAEDLAVAAAHLQAGSS